MSAKPFLPVAGLGTRFLPATKAMPKEMLTVVDRPLIQYAVEECLAAGIEEFVFVTGRNKIAIEDHFDHAYELEATLDAARQEARAEADAGRRPSSRAMRSSRASRSRSASAMPCGARATGSADEPFAVLLPDELTIDTPSCTAQLVAAHDKTGGNVVAVMDVPREQTKSYGIAAVKAGEGRAGRDHRPGREAQARGGAVDPGADRPLRAAARGVRPSRPARDRRRRRDPAHRRLAKMIGGSRSMRCAMPAGATTAAAGSVSSRRTSPSRCTAPTPRRRRGRCSSAC